MSADEDDNDSPLVPRVTKTAREPLLASGEEQLTTDNDNSYTEFYARLGTREEELTLSTAGSLQEHRTSVSSSQDQESSTLIRDRDSTSDGESPGGGRITFNRPKMPSPAGACMIGTAFLFVIILLWWASNGSKNILPPNWEPASAYEVSFTMTLPSGLEEPGIAMVDQRTGMMRVSYYAGMATYIFSTKGPSWSIIPRVYGLTCFEEHGEIQLQKVFPDFKRFKFVRQRDLIVKHRLPGQQKFVKDDDKNNNKVRCAEWIYRAKDGADGGYKGTYTLWTLIGTNVPVRFKFTGRSVILGKSYHDDFTIDYYGYKDLTNEGGVDPFWLVPPRGMPCFNVSEHDHHNHTLPSLHAEKWNTMFPEHDDERDQLYQAFHAEHSVKEKSEARKLIFHQSLRLVEAHNRDKSKTYSIALNKFADWTLEERMALLSLQGMKEDHWYRLPKSNCTVEKLEDILVEAKTTDLPKKCDHYERGLIRGPFEQGSCGASWAVAVTGVVEGHIAKQTKKGVVALSVQNVVDCAAYWPIGGLTCEVGLDYLGFQWAIRHNQGHIATEESYPRLDQPGFCHFDKRWELFADGAHAESDSPNITECVHVSEAFSFANSSTQFKSEDLIKALNLRLNSVGPLAVSVDVSPHDFFLYGGGVYQSSNCHSDAPKLDHSMLAVGYDLDDNVNGPYTILRNSWGTTWGIDGYMHLAQKGNMCGAATAPMYVRS